LALGAKMVPFAGTLLPISYPSGIVAEHRHCRDAAALFDVSHMGQLHLHGDGASAALEGLVPADIVSLAPGQMRYTLLTDDSGGILDDLIVTRTEDGLALVVNAARKAQDLAHLESALPAAIAIEPLEDRALIALQGPAAAAIMAEHAPRAGALDFMAAAALRIVGTDVTVSRAGYTGEDGFEISLAAGDAVSVAQALLDHPSAAPAGLGARDSLRLEAGLCLYGHDIDSTTTPVEAGLAWTIAKRRRRGRGFPGAARILRQISDGAPRRRLGLRPDGAQIAREGAVVRDRDGAEIGRVTSGGYGPSLAGPVAMGYVARDAAVAGRPVTLSIRGKAVSATLAALPFVPHRYHGA
jgi:aminomethyltransferase